MTIQIPDSVLEKAGLSADQIRLELAIMLFQQERITSSILPVNVAILPIVK